MSCSVSPLVFWKKEKFGDLSKDVTEPIDQRPGNVLCQTHRLSESCEIGIINTSRFLPET